MKLAAAVDQHSSVMLMDDVGRFLEQCDDIDENYLKQDASTWSGVQGGSLVR